MEHGCFGRRRMRDSHRVGQASRLDLRICPLGLASERDRRDACPTLD